MEKSVKIPLWITLFGGFLAVFGLGLGIMGYLQPDMVIPGFTGDTYPHKMAIWMTSARNIAMGVVMTYALLSKKPELIGFAFLMRVVTELFDMPATAISGVMGSVPSGAIYAVYLLLFIIPEMIAIKSMWSLSKAG
ncbi:MAG: hypothetical protein AAF399_24420 [Bacteroidota bacterium]